VITTWMARAAVRGVLVASMTVAVTVSASAQQRVLDSVSTRLLERDTDSLFVNLVRSTGCAETPRGRDETTRAVRDWLGPLMPTEKGTVINTKVLFRNLSAVFTEILVRTGIGGTPVPGYMLRPIDRDIIGVALLLHGSGTLPQQWFGVRLDGEGGVVSRGDSLPMTSMGTRLAEAGFVVVAPVIGTQPEYDRKLPWLDLALIGEVLRRKVVGASVVSVLLSEAAAFVDVGLSETGGGSPVVVVGWKEGAMLAALLASRDSRISVIGRLESPFDRRAFRLGSGTLRDASFLHAECWLSDKAQASLTPNTKIFYSPASDDPDQMVRRDYNSPSIAAELSATSRDRTEPVRILPEGSSADVPSRLAQALTEAIGARPDSVSIIRLKVKDSEKFPTADVTERTNIIGSFIGSLPSCVLPQGLSPNSARSIPSRQFGVVTGLRADVAIGPAKALSRQRVDSTEGYILWRVTYGAERFIALVAEPTSVAVDARPALLSFNGTDDLIDLFDDRQVGRTTPYLNGYAASFAKRGYVVVVPLMATWYPEIVSPVSYARIPRISNPWTLLLAPYYRAIAYLMGRGDVDAKRIAAYGISFGGTAALLATATSPEISALVYSDVPVKFRDEFDHASGLFTNSWLAAACPFIDAAFLAVPSRLFVWEAGEDPNMLNANIDLVDQMRALYASLGEQHLFSFIRHSGGHETRPLDIRIFEPQ
jgi:dienelactone hydrolase